MPSPWFRVLKDRLDVEVLPVELEWSKDFYPKAYGFYNRIQDMSSEDVIMCVDAFDVVPSIDCSEEILKIRLFENFKMDKLVFNSEKIC